MKLVRLTARLTAPLTFALALAAGCAAGTIQPNGNRDMGGGGGGDEDMAMPGSTDLAGYDLTGFDLAPPPADFAGVDLTGTCVHECNPNTEPKRCQPGSSVTVETCAVGPLGCYVWTSPMVCANGGSCTGNGTCMTGCTNGQTRCGAGNSVESCSSNSWTFTQSCPFGCMIGGGGAASCVTSVSCTPGQTRCNATNGVEVCNASGTAWLAQATCANGCSAGLCTGGCTSGQKRCNANKVETCNGAGTAWTVTTDCAMASAVCDIASATCAVSSLTIDATAQKDYNGILVVNGPLVVKNGQTLTSTTGDLTIRATSITVEQGAGISVSATGDTAEGRAGAPYSGYSYNGGCGGGYGSTGGSGYNYSSGCGGGSSFGSTTDAVVMPGSKGSAGNSGSAAGGAGGGVLRLIADTILVQGAVRADGQQGTNTSGSSGAGGGGSGGGILLAADSITIDTGATVSAAGGAGGINNSNPSYYYGGVGGPGRVKILGGATRVVSGTIVGTKTEGLLPPTTITSSTHPNPSLVYNDNFQSVALSWNRAFPSRQGYWGLFNTTQFQVPAPGAGVDYILGNEVKSYDRTKLASLPANGAQQWYFHLAPENASSVTGTVENNFRIQVSTAVPTIATPTHPNNTTWYADTVSTSWTFPSLAQNTQGDANWKGVYYVFDQYGDTVPDPGSATFAPNTKKTQTFSPVANGLWVMHVVTVDQMGYLTKKAAHALVRVWASGTPPAVGAVQGGVTQGGSPVNGVKVSLNRGLIPFASDGSGAVTTSGSGNFTIPNVPPGTYQLRAVLPNGTSKEVMVTVTSSVTADTNVTF